jgi:hypothetical protein
MSSFYIGRGLAILLELSQWLRRVSAFLQYALACTRPLLFSHVCCPVPIPHALLEQVLVMGGGLRPARIGQANHNYRRDEESDRQLQ